MIKHASRLLGLAFLVLFALSGCGGSGGDGTTAVQMTVTSTLPAATDIGVPPDSNVTITWDMAVDCNTIDETTVTSDSPGWALVSCSDDHAIFAGGGQSYGATYSVSVSSAVQSVGGAVSIPNNFSYTVAAAPLSWGGTTLFGGADVDVANYGATDDNDNVYLVGSTGSFILGETPFGGDDAFVAKLDETGAVVWATQFGGVGNDFANGVVVVGSEVYVVGDTTTGDLGAPVPGDTLAAGTPDAFLAKFDAATGNEIWIRQFGTIQEDIAWSVDADAVGDIIVAGVTAGTLTGAGAPGDDDAFLAKFSDVPDTDLLPGKRLWVSQYGFDLTTEDAVSVVVADGFIYTAGETGELDTGNGDAYAARNAASDGSQLGIWILGQNTDTDYANKLILDASGAIYLAGLSATDIDGDGVTVAGVSDGFLAKIDPQSATPVQWVEVLASADYDEAFGVDLDRFGNLYVTGEADGNLVGESNGWVALGDIFVGRYTLDGDRNWLDFLGTAGNDAGFDVFLGTRGMVFAAGTTEGDLDGNVGSNQGLEDAFIARYTSGGVLE